MVLLHSPASGSFAATGALSAQPLADANGNVDLVPAIGLDGGGMVLQSVIPFLTEKERKELMETYLARTFCASFRRWCAQVRGVITGAAGCVASRLCVKGGERELDSLMTTFSLMCC